MLLGHRLKVSCGFPIVQHRIWGWCVVLAPHVFRLHFVWCSQVPIGPGVQIPEDLTDAYKRKWLHLRRKEHLAGLALRT